MGRAVGTWLWRVWCAVGVAAVVVYLLLPDGLYLNVIYDVIGLVSAAMIVVGVRIHRPARPRIWYCFAAGQATWVAGDVVYGVYVQLGMEPFPSPADALYLAAYPILVAGMFMLIRGRVSGRDRAGLLDASIIATGLGLLSWTFLMRPIALDDTSDLVTRLVAMAYPAADILIIAMVARLFASPGARTTAYRMFIGALLTLVVGDIAYAVLTTLFTYTGGLIDAAWLASYVLWGAAALHPSMRSLSEVAPDKAVRFTRKRFSLLAATSLLAPGLLFFEGITNPSDVDWVAIGIGAVVLFLLVLARMSGLVAQVQDQATQLASLAHNDSLTGVPNRRAWDLELVREMALAHRTGMSVSVVLLDLDHFKKFNDQFGHQAGDRLLTQAAALWRAQLREHDFLARYGGEEFGLIIPGLSPEDAGAIVDRMRAATPDSQSFSAGVATWNRVESPENLVGRADGALYRAKGTGRNRVELAVTPAPSAHGDTDLPNAPDRRVESVVAGR